MAVQQSQVLPAQFVQDLGQDLAKQVTAQSGVPVVSTGIAGISQQPGETAADFAARQSAAQAIYNKTTKFIRTCTTSSWSRCTTNTSSNISSTRCRIFSTIFKSSTNTSNFSFWIRNTGSRTIRRNWNWSNFISTRCTRLYVSVSITSN
jgi:hypothetical protein